MDLLQAVLLGIVQGIAEWLPISSSGHLVLVQEFFRLDVPVLFDVILHLGTLLVVLLVFWKDLLAIIKSLLALRWDEYTKLALFILIASIPAALIGYLFRDFFASLFSNTFAVGFAFLATGTILFLTRYAREKHSINWKNSLVIGFAQAIAIIPGISRSGSTISAGLLLGVKREKIARFSFLLSVPAVLGAAVLESKDFAKIEVLPALVGTLVSVVIGYFALKYLLKLVEKGKLYYFSWYCWGLGFAVLAFSLL
jgi:undecaprenyl-diphosphatase